MQIEGRVAGGVADAQFQFLVLELAGVDQDIALDDRSVLQPGLGVDDHAHSLLRRAGPEDKAQCEKSTGDSYAHTHGSLSKVRIETILAEEIEHLREVHGKADALDIVFDDLVVVDPDHLVIQKQRPAGVSRIYRRVGLNEPDLLRTRRIEALAFPHGADNAARDGEFQAVRMADRFDRSA